MHDRELEVRPRDAAVRCATCHAPLDLDAALRCERCGTLQHADCDATLTSCPTLGCRAPAPCSRPADVPTEAELPLPSERPWTAFGAFLTISLLLVSLSLLFGGLGRPGPSWTFRWQVEAFRDGDADVEALPVLLETLRRTPRIHHHRALRAVATRCGLRAVPTLRARWPAERDHPLTTSWVLEYAVEVGAVELLPEVVEALRASDDTVVRWDAYGALAALGPRAERLPEGTREVLERGLVHPDPTERFHARLAFDALF